MYVLSLFMKIKKIKKHQGFSPKRLKKIMVLSLESDIIKSSKGKTPKQRKVGTKNVYNR
jgi:hypothetical protein